jgi:hypothetical protein
MLRVRFSGPVRLDTLRDGLSLVYGEVRHRDGFATYPVGHRKPVNQLSWDPRTNTVYAKPEEQLEQDRDYFLVVTDKVLDLAGRPVVADARFQAPVPVMLGSGVVAYSRFHTMNVVRSLRSADLGPRGSWRREQPGVVDLEHFVSFEVLEDVFTEASAPLRVSDVPVDMAFLRGIGLRRLALFSFENGRGERIHGHVWLPSTPPPPGGYPVVIAGHGLGDSRFGGPSLFAGVLGRGAAVVSINAVGHGYGPRSVLRLTRANNSSVQIPAPGRGRDTDGTGTIDAFEGCVLLEPGQPAFIRDCLRQTALDLRKLVREIEGGMDLDGDGRVDLDAANITYLGQSLGAMYGSIFLGLEGNVKAAVLNAGGGTALKTARYSPGLRPLLALYIGAVHPQLLSGFLQLPDPLTARHEDVVVLQDPRSGPYLELLDRFTMLETDGAPASFAPFFKQATLFGNAIKPVLFQYALGDQTVPNPANGQLIRGGFEYDLVSVYRHDRARREVPGLPVNPHTYLAAFVQFRPETVTIGVAALEQARLFLANPEAGVPDVNGLVREFFRENLFEVPVQLP